MGQRLSGQREATAEAHARSVAERIFHAVLRSRGPTPRPRDRTRERKAHRKPAPKRQPPKPPVTSPPVRNGLGQCVADCARQQVGKPYRWATAGPDTFDCSGLAAFCSTRCGQPITRSSYGQIELGSPVGRDELQPGDLLFWDTEGNGRAGHTGVYVGDGQAVSALNEARGVITHAVGAQMGGPYLGARRLRKE